MYELVARNIIFPFWINYLLFISILLLTFLKFRKPLVFHQIYSILFKPLTTASFLKEEFKPFGFTNILLLVNYFVVMGVFFYMLKIHVKATSYFLVFLPLLLYFFQLFTLLGIGLISGESKRISQSVFLLNFFTHLIGIVFLPFIIIWLLNVQNTDAILLIGIIVFYLLHLIRIFKGISNALQNKIRWYYIILYLCTAEIWGWFLFVYYLTPYFNR